MLSYYMENVDIYIYICMENVGRLFFFHISSEHYTRGYYGLWPSLCLQIFQFCYSFTPCKGVKLNSIKRRRLGTG